MNFSDISWLLPALKCLAMVVLMAMLAVALCALGAWWMSRQGKKQ